MMSEGTRAMLPGWARALAVVVGIVSIILGVVVLAYPGLALLTLIYLLALAFLFIGIDRLIAGITGHPYYWFSPFTPPPSQPPSK
jgi:uncharacterized membrane protein HdeD (DUF308 family)